MITKREHKRVPITGSAVLKFEYKGEIRSIQAMTGSISLGGIGLYADDRIEDDTNVSIAISFIAVDGVKTDSIEGCAVYNKNIANMYFMGIQFNEEINSEKQPSLYEHIQKILTWNE
jgi:c-di-GMP-binding flagellar brake protein YcgR